jgi:hypothetical protein
MTALDMTKRIDTPDFRAEPATLTWHNGKRYWMRVCYELVAGKWEGFVSMRPVVG